MKIAKISRLVLNLIIKSNLRSNTPYFCKLLTDREERSLHEPIRVYLSESNVRTLLSKLDRVRNGEQSRCTLVKRDTVHPLYPCQYVTSVTAVEDSAPFEDINFIFYVIADEEYYSERAAGEIHPKDR